MSGWHIIILVFGLVIYLLPGVIASSRMHKNSTAIWVLNIVLGWSFLGWVAALVWAFTNPGGNQATTMDTKGIETGHSLSTDLKNAPTAQKTSKKRLFCAGTVAKTFPPDKYPRQRPRIAGFFYTHSFHFLQ
ncbi:superinfection immunity protein [Leclercia adecarboxylata]|uniref:superinfection immunity protein n=1 Tax=Leclercia adecarboxylata TaxID=83655 RepID=UPI000DFF5B31|nr:Uncharacterised protein [Leclercia adecarboxylata]